MRLNDQAGQSSQTAPAPCTSAAPTPAPGAPSHFAIRPIQITFPLLRLQKAPSLLISGNITYYLPAPQRASDSQLLMPVAIVAVVRKDSPIKGISNCNRRTSFHFTHAMPYDMSSIHSFIFASQAVLSYI